MYFSIHQYTFPYTLCMRGHYISVYMPFHAVLIVLESFVFYSSREDLIRRVAPSNTEFKALSTLIRFQTKTELFCSGYGYRPRCNAENDHRKRSHSKTLSRVERFENNAFCGKRCFLEWTAKAMLSENGDVIK